MTKFIKKIPPFHDKTNHMKSFIHVNFMCYSYDAGSSIYQTFFKTLKAYFVYANIFFIIKQFTLKNIFIRIFLINQIFFLFKL